MMPLSQFEIDELRRRCEAYRSLNPAEVIDLLDERDALKGAIERAVTDARREALKQAFQAAAPYHDIGGSGRGCPRFCGACQRSREIQDAIRALPVDVRPMFCSHEVKRGDCSDLACK